MNVSVHVMYLAIKAEGAPSNGVAANGAVTQAGQAKSLCPRR